MQLINPQTLAFSRGAEATRLHRRQRPRGESAVKSGAWGRCLSHTLGFVAATSVLFALSLPIASRPADFSSVPKSPSGFLHPGGWQAGGYIAGQRLASGGQHPHSQIPQHLSHSFPSARSALQLYPFPDHPGAAFNCLMLST